MKYQLPSLNFIPEYFTHVRNWHGHMPFAIDLIYLTKPRIIVELGTHFGDSYFAFCQSCKELEIETELYAVDHWRGDLHSGFYDESVFSQVNSFNQNHYENRSKLVRRDFKNAKSHFQNGTIDILHIDGAHDYDSIKYDFNSWKSKVSNPGFVLIHDTLVKERGFGVHKLWDEIRECYHSFEFKFSCGLGVLLLGNLESLPAEIVQYFIPHKFSDIHDYYKTQANRILSLSK